MIDASIFRVYDIRGLVGETLTETTVSLLGNAIGSLVLESGEEQVIIARDGRISGKSLSQALCSGILETGCDVIDIGMVPTPLLYYATHVLNTHSGVMLTGSHNPPQYNGLKIVVNGKTLMEETIQALYQRICEKKFREGLGCRYELDIMSRYIDHVSQDVGLDRALRIVIDAGNGITGIVAPQLYKSMGCEVHELYCDVDGNFPHHHPDPSDPKNLQTLIQTVIEKRADIGLAFDGDGDRLGVVTSRGEIIWPDRLLMLYAKSILGESPCAKIIYDVKCTNHLDPLIREYNGEPIMWKTGHSLIKAKLAETKAKLAGEMSGHFFFNDRWYGFDDALYAGARLLQILAQQDLDSHALFATIPNSINTPELKVLVSEEEKFSLMRELIDRANFTEALGINIIDGLRVNFANGWGLVRPSNTTPYLVLRFEAINEVILQNIQSIFRTWMLSVKPDLVLPF